jgi:hypothetical protein
MPLIDENTNAGHRSTKNTHSKNTQFAKNKNTNYSGN